MRGPTHCPICNVVFLSPLAHPPHTPAQRRLQRVVRRCIGRWRLRARVSRLIATLPDPDDAWDEAVCGECLSVFDTEAELDAHRERMHPCDHHRDPDDPHAPEEMLTVHPLDGWWHNWN